MCHFQSRQSVRENVIHDNVRHIRCSLIPMQLNQNLLRPRFAQSADTYLCFLRVRHMPPRTVNSVVKPMMSKAPSKYRTIALYGGYIPMAQQLYQYPDFPSVTQQFREHLIVVVLMMVQEIITANAAQKR